MKALSWLCIYLLIPLVFTANNHQAEIDNNDFAEFEELDEEGDLGGEQEDVEETGTDAAPGQGEDEEDGVVEDEEDEFEHLQDEEEFEGFYTGDMPLPGKSRGSETPELKITKVPLHLRTNWDSFYMEMLMLGGLAVYFINFIIGRTKNNKLATYWFSAHKDLFESNFHVVGDDGTSKEVQQDILMKESENIYSLWCSGRTCCEGMLVQLKFLKRQDLISIMAYMLRPASDQIYVKVTMTPEDMDTFVFAVATKKTATKLIKEMNDLSLYCPEKKSAEKFGLPSSFTVLSEIGEATAAILDTKMVSILTKYEEMIDYIHFSDQYCGPKSQEENQNSKPLQTAKVLIFNLNVPGKGKVNPQTMENMKPVLQLVFYCMEKIKRFKLSKEAKNKSDKNRLKVEESYLRNTHSQRQEAAQQRREDKRRAEKERILNEDDPEKQRKWEEREHRRELKKRAPKVKQMKVKAM